MEAAAVALSATKVTHLNGPLDRHGLLHVIADHVVMKPKTTIRNCPRGDVDNYAKATLDAITKCGHVWEDDDQVLILTTTKRFAEKGEEPHTKVTVCNL